MHRTLGYRISKPKRLQPKIIIINTLLMAHLNMTGHEFSISLSRPYANHRNLAMHVEVNDREINAIFLRCTSYDSLTNNKYDKAVLLLRGLI
jgi:hypothetical protein